MQNDAVTSPLIDKRGIQSQTFCYVKCLFQDASCRPRAKGCSQILIGTLEDMVDENDDETAAEADGAPLGKPLA